MKLPVFYANLPCGTPVKIPADTLEDFKVMYKGIPVSTTPPPKKEKTA